MSAPLHTLQEAELYCNKFISPPQQQKKRTLTRMKRLMRALGNPQKNLTVIQVGGSSGKGSTAYMTATLLEHAGYSVGLHIKPHLQSLTERIAINRQVIPDDIFIDYLNKIKTYIDTISTKNREHIPTYFEIIVAVALHYFSDKRVDYVVLEVGRGGRVDATNICTSTLSIITNISRVHTEILGNTLQEITSEKLGIVKNKTIVVSGITQPSLQSYIQQYCRAKHAPLVTIQKDFQFTIPTESTKNGMYTDTQQKISDIPMPLLGMYQQQNAALAIRAATYLVPINSKQIQNAFQSMKLPGRLEIVLYKGNTIMMDSAHNLITMQALVASCKALFPKQKMSIVLPLQQKRIMKQYIQLLHPIMKRLFVIIPSSKIPHQNKKTNVPSITSLLPSKSMTPVTNHDLITILSQPTPTPFLITGSMTILGTIRTGLHLPYRLK